jgi:hypothetical protein
MANEQIILFSRRHTAGLLGKSSNRVRVDRSKKAEPAGGSSRQHRLVPCPIACRYLKIPRSGSSPVHAMDAA